MTSPSRSDHSPERHKLSNDGSIFAEFGLAPGLAHLNHGSYGAVPHVVRDAQRCWRDRIELNPTGFFQEELPGLMREAAGHAARRFGGERDDWVFCENATAAINGILGATQLGPGDEILTTSHAYGAVVKAMQLWAERHGARFVSAALPSFLEHDGAIVDAIAASIRTSTRLIIIDHITSATATILPVKRIALLARQAGIPLLVDGAHAPGQIALDVPSLGADWYVGNAHKWLFAPRGCAILWTDPARQTGTFPAVLSHGTPEGYTAAFDWIGTRDVTPWLCFEDGAAVHDEFGGAQLMARNHTLANTAGALLCDALGAEVTPPSSMRGAMATLALPLACDDLLYAQKFRRVLAEDHGVVVPAYPWDGRLCFRISAQIYNRLGDYERCADAIREVLTH